jgi:DNA repair protein RadA/Sms
MRYGDLVLAVDPEDRRMFYVDDARPGISARLVHDRIPVQGLDTLDGPEYLGMVIAAALAEHGLVVPDVPHAWYERAEAPLAAEYWTAADEQAEAATAAGSELDSELVDLSKVAPAQVEPLWGGTRMALKKLTLAQGDPGVGKSFALLKVAADLSRVGRRVLILQVEDGIADTTVPRLHSLGADLSLIKAFPVGKAPVLDTAGIAKLEQHVAHWRPSLVIVDPVTYFLGAKVDMHRANEVRECLAALARIAEQYDTAIVPIIHMNKGSAKALYRSLGSIDFSAAVRSVLMFGHVEQEPDRGRAIFHIKCNYGAREEPAGYDIVDGAFLWRATDITLAEAEGRKPGPKPLKTRECREWLWNLLAAWPLDSGEVKLAADDDGIAAATLKKVSIETPWLLKTKVEGTRGFLWARANAAGGSTGSSS